VIASTDVSMQYVREVRMNRSWPSWSLAAAASQADASKQSSKDGGTFGACISVPVQRSLVRRNAVILARLVKMPRGPKGEKRLADVIGNAAHVMRSVTGEITTT
jgi:hypothetical protein